MPSFTRTSDMMFGQRWVFSAKTHPQDNNTHGSAILSSEAPFPINRQAYAPSGVRNFTVSGQAITSLGAGYPSAIVKLFRSGDDSWVATTTADGSGNFSFTIPSNSGTFWVAAFDTAGNPGGVSVRTLKGV